MHGPEGPLLEAAENKPGGRIPLDCNQPSDDGTEVAVPACSWWAEGKEKT